MYVRCFPFPIVITFMWNKLWPPENAKYRFCIYLHPCTETESIIMIEIVVNICL